MTESENCWSEDWEERLKSELESRGFESIACYLRDNSGVTYEQLAGELGDFAPLQVQILQMREAEHCGRIRDTARDALVRKLRSRVKRGWGVGPNAETRAAAAYASWLNTVSMEGNCPEYEPRMERVWDALEQLPPPQGWLPESTDDPLIERAFAEGWPEHATESSEE